MRFWVIVGVLVVLIGLGIAGIFCFQQEKPSAEAAKTTPPGPSAEGKQAPPPAPPKPSIDATEAPAPEPAAPEIPEQAAEEDAGVVKVRVYGTVTDSTTGEPIADAILVAETPFFPGSMRAEDLEEMQEDAEKLAVEAAAEAGRKAEAIAQRESGRSVEGDTSAETITSADGSFSFEVEAKGRTRIVCEAKGYARAEEGLPKPAKGDVRLDFILDAGAGIAGVVTDVQSGQGIAGVEVMMSGTKETMFERMQRMSGVGRGLKAKTEDDGSYSIEGLKPGSYRVAVLARKAGYIFRAQDTVTAQIEKGTFQEGVNFKLERGGVVEGTVRTPEQQPAKEAEVGVFPEQLLDAAMKGMEGMTPDFFTDSTERTDEAGSFRIMGLDYDTGYRLRAESEGYASADSPVFRVVRGEPPAHVDITLTIGSRVSGHVRNADQTTAPKCRVTLFPDLGSMFSGNIQEPKFAETDDSGAFQIEHVSAGKYSVSVGQMQPFSMDPSKKNTIIEVDGVHDVSGLELMQEQTVAATPKEKGSGVIEGVVVSSEGKPVDGVRVDATQSNNPMMTSGASTGEGGAFAIQNLRGESYNLLVTCDDGRGEQKGVAVGAKVTIRLEPPTSVSGVVVNASGETVAACKVSLKKQTAPGEKEDMAQTMAAFMANLMGGGGGQQTDAYGAFEFKNVAPADYIVKAESSSDGTGQSETFTLAAGASKKGLRVVLQPGVQFSGEVRTKNGEPISGAQVALMPDAEDDMLGMMNRFLPAGMQQTAGSATTDESGQFLIAQVAPGTYMAAASHPEFAKTVRHDVEITAGHDVTGYALVLTEGGKAGGVYLVDGQPVAGAMAQLIGPDGTFMMTTDANGRFDFSNLPAGTYMLNTVDMSRISQGDFLAAAGAMPRVVDIAEGQNTEIDFSGAGGLPVGGTISGEGLGNITTVTLRQPAGAAMETLDPMDISAMIEAVRSMGGKTVVGADGTFHMEGVEPGTYILDVYTLDIDLQNPDFSALMNMEYKPLISQEVVVGDGPVTLNLSVGGAAAGVPSPAP